MSSTPPTALGKYQIIREIARSNDIVYEGYDPLMTRRVAVKELNMPVGATPQQAEDRISRFKREAQAAGRLNHPNIMTVYDVEEDGGRLFMAMEYLDGQTLRAEIDGHGKLAPERAVEVARAVLAGLGHAHALGVVHRDIKPDNVQILSNGSIKITDFGIARLTFQPNLTMDGQVFGTPSYMSPEQVVGKEIDPRSDLFSVGVMLYEMLAGAKPFAGDSVVAITYAIMNREPDPLPDAVPYALAEAVRRSLEKTPHLRYDSADAMADALAEALKPPPPQPVYDPVPSTPAPQGYSPYGAPPVVNAPYNPYGAPSPYGAPAPAPIPSTPAPAAYGYNPYTQAPYGGPGPTMAPPQTQVPIYYPPPPRQPLLKPETAAFIKKFVVAFVVIGTFFALILVAVWALLTQLGRIQATKSSESIVRTIGDIPPNMPLDEQIKLLIGKRAQIPANADTTEFDAFLGGKYRSLALQEMQSGRYDLAERDYMSAEKYTPHDPKLLYEYAQLYQAQAQASLEGSPERSERYRMASEKYLSARVQENDPNQQAKNGWYGAQAAYLAGLNALRSEDRTAMRAAYTQLQEARAYAGADPNLRSQIEGLLRDLSP